MVRARMLAGRSASWRTPRMRAALLLAICLVAMAISAPLGLIASLQRYAVLSFDNPATQLLDELASGKAATTDPFSETTTALRMGADHRNQLTARDGCRVRSNASLDTLEARAPPTA